MGAETWLSSSSIRDSEHACEWDAHFRVFLGQFERVPTEDQ